MHGSNFASSGVGSRGYAINISSPPSLFFERAESSVSFENGICGPSGWRYVEKVENEVCQTPHFYTFFFRIYPKNIRISTWLFLLLETRPSRLNFWSNASQTGATERWVSILRVGLCWEWIIRSFESNKEFASSTFANLSPSLLFREDREASYFEFLFYFWNYYRKTRILVSPQCLSLGKKLSTRNVSISCRIHEFIVFSIFISSAWIMFPLDPRIQRDMTNIKITSNKRDKNRTVDVYILSSFLEWK